MVPAAGPFMSFDMVRLVEKAFNTTGLGGATYCGNHIYFFFHSTSGGGASAGVGGKGLGPVGVGVGEVYKA